MEHLTNNPKSFLFAILGGAIPAMFWLWFWLKEEDDNKEPRGLVILSFLLGGILVLIAIWIEKYFAELVLNESYLVIIWAVVEEIIKLLGVMLIVSSSRIIDNPIDYPMYFISVALGFAAFENVLYLLKPVYSDGTVISLLTGNLRFLGSTLLHAIASGLVGSALGLAFYLKKYKFTYMIFGLTLAIVLHSTFNFFIMKDSGENFLSIFGLLWVVAIISILIFEKLKRMGDEPKSPEVLH